jgi:putative phosphoesterase
VVSDTHGRLDPRLLELFRGVDHILHAGDVGSQAVLEGLRELAPLTAVRGNVDSGPHAWDLPVEAEVELCGNRILVRHIREELLAQGPAALEGYQVVVVGHSHKPLVEKRQDLLFVNPGSAGPRRFRLPRAAALLELSPGGEPRAEIVILEQAAR